MLKQLPAYVALTKPRIAVMVLITTAFGYFLALGTTDWSLAFWLTMLGTAFTGGGASVLNQYLERDVDARMERTKNRPLVTGSVSPEGALFFGVGLVLSGCLLLLWRVNIVAAYLALQSAFLYVLVYTPLKRLSWWNTSIGAIPGAMPPLIGWAAATGTLTPGAWILFFILYIWQHPHFFAIAWMYREDYARGGLKMLPVVQPDGRNMFGQVVWFSVVLIPVSLLPSVIGMSGSVYTVGALVAGIGMLVYAVLFARSRSVASARAELRASIVYLPALLVLIMLDAAL